MAEPIQVDLAEKKSEADWQIAIDRFWLATTPELFKWLGWVAALTALKFVADKTHNVWISMIQGICYCAIIFYFNAFFYRFHFLKPPFIKSPRGRRFISLLLSGVLACLAGWLTFKAIDAISGARI